MNDAHGAPAKTVSPRDQSPRISRGAQSQAVQRACVMGASLDVGNQGVLALGVSVAYLIADASPQCEIAFHYGHVTGGVRYLEDSGSRLRVEILNCRLSPRSAPGEHVIVILASALLYRLGIRGPARRNAWLRSLLDADFVGDITGGDSFSDIYGLRRFLIGCLPLVSARVLKRPYVMLPQTFGPFRSQLARTVASILLRGATTVLTRDRNSSRIVEDLSGRTPLFCPDVAFTLKPKKPLAVASRPGRVDLEATNLFGLNISGLLYMGGYTRSNMFGLKSDYKEMVERLIESVLDTTNATVLLVPHVFGSEEQEQEANDTVLSALGTRYRGRLFALSGELSERELKWVIGRTSFFVGSRMHACIAALSQCVPAVGLSYSDKFLGVFQSAGVGDAIVDLRKSDTSDVVAYTLQAWATRFELARVLGRQIPDLVNQIRRTFDDLLQQPPVDRTPTPELKVS